MGNCVPKNQLQVKTVQAFPRWEESFAVEDNPELREALEQVTPLVLKEHQQTLSMSNILPLTLLGRGGCASVLLATLPTSSNVKQFMEGVLQVANSRNPAASEQASSLTIHGSCPEIDNEFGCVTTGAPQTPSAWASVAPVRGNAERRLSFSRPSIPSLFALKVIPFPPESAKHARRLNTLMNERKVLAKLQHPLIANLHFAVVGSGYAAMAIDYCRGGDLHAILKRYPTHQLPEHYVKFYAASALVALEYVHRKGFLHRDIKPENFLLDGQGFLKLADFGIAQEMKHGVCDAHSGTLAFMAPETLYGTREHGTCSDFYSLGVSLFQLLVGHRPCKL